MIKIFPNLHLQTKAMRSYFLLLIVITVVYGCNKTTKSEPAPPTIVIVPEEKISFTTNIDTGKVLLDDNLSLNILVTSKIPPNGIQYTITTTWNDSSKQIFKLDTSATANSISVNLNGHNRTGNYNISIIATSKSLSTNTTSKTIGANYIPFVSAVNTELDSKLNWNDHSQGKSAPYDFNKDGIPDIVTWTGRSFDAKKPPLLIIKDYTGKSIFSFNIKDKKTNMRDSLNNLLYDYRDINNDGFNDFALTYMGEWDPNPNAGINTMKFNGINTFLLFSKGGFEYDVVEVLDIPKFSQFNINLFDWDFDGLSDLLASDMSKGIYFKNLGNNKFEEKSLNPLFVQGMSNKYDYDKDGRLDFINLYVNQIDENGNLVSNNNNQTLSIVTSKTVINMQVTGKKIEKYIYPTNNKSTAERITLLDGDNDGDMDLVVGGFTIENNSWSYFQDYFENIGGQFNFKPNFIEIDKSLIGENQVWAGDIDNDGDIDLYYPTYSKSQLNMPKWKYFWWENTKSGFKINKSFRLKY